MVNMPASEEATVLSRSVPNLSVGLHVNFTYEDRWDSVVLPDEDACRTELHKQFSLYQELMGRLPTHLDSHHNIHKKPYLLPHFLDLAQQYSLPLRGYSPIRYFSNFYGQWDGDTHLEQISVETLVQILENELREGVTELSCHPGYVDPNFKSVYSIEREVELRTLCDPIIKNKIIELGIKLTNYQDVDKFQMDES
jgi:predicted glycoside hydrolase/deacetylase ChbG (UPF0249 family)